MTIPPANVTITAQQTATFAVTASSDQPIKYQWYKGGTLITGATANSYTTPAMPLAQNGSTFTVAVTDGTMTSTTSAALLTVLPKQTVLTLASIPAVVFGDPAFQVTAVSNSQGPISYAVASGPATISGAMLTVTGAGPVVLAATQVASGDYGPASTSKQFFVAPLVSVGAISPANKTMGPGTQAFAASATGGATNNIVWTASGGSFTGNVWTAPNTAGKYTIVATSLDDPTKSASTSAIISRPIITQQPQGGAFCPNANLSMTVAAEYADTYQWTLNGSPLNGARGPANVTVANPQLDAGQYTATVSNPAGSVDSNTIDVTIGSSITTNPQSVAVSVNQVASFSTSATGVAPFSYQWYRQPPQLPGGLAIPGAVSSTYATPAVNGTYNGDQYYVVVTDACQHSMTSGLALLTVGGISVPPTIIVPPAGQATLPGGSAVFSVEAVGSPTLTYQWFWVPAGTTQGAPVTGATAAAQYSVPTTSITTANDQDQYYVVVTNPYGQASSTRATLSVGAGILITQQPITAYVQAGASTTYTVAATSSLPLTYQWYEADPGSSSFTLLAGATSTTYTVTGTTVSQSGSDFYVIVSNGVTTSVQSNLAALFVGPLSSIPACSQNWNVVGVAVPTANCDFELLPPDTNRHGEIVWPSLIATDNVLLKFTVATSNSSPIPADGFAVVFGDPALGATLTSIGIDGEGLGARGIPGLVVAFDTFLNGGQLTGPPGSWPQDPVVPYVGITRGEDMLWERPYFIVNTGIPPLVTYGQTISHDYVLNLVHGYLTMTMDGTQILSGIVSVPPASFLYITGSTGSDWEQTDISNISAVVKAP